MLKPLKNLFLKFYNKEVDGTGLAIFRILYSLVLLCEISQMFYFRHLIFDAIPYINFAEIDFAYPIGIWFVSVFFILIGAFTRLATIVNYLMSLSLIGTINFFEYHVFYAYMGINFFLMFMPISKAFSFDRLFEKLKYSSTTFHYKPDKKVKSIYYLLLPFVGIGLVYLDSVFYKLASPMWVLGLGAWHPASLPMVTHVNTSFILNIEFLVKFSGWLTIFFETVFLFVFFRKSFRWAVLFVGIALHLGILLQFPIPWFALTVSFVYFLIIPVSVWQKIFTIKPNPSLFFYYDSECPLCLRTKIIVEHFDWFGKVQFKTVQFDAAENEKLKDISQDVLFENIHSTDKNGNVYIGLNTYIQVFKRVFIFFPLYLILLIPGISLIAKKIYQYVASNRETKRCSVETCGFTPPQIIEDKEVKILQNFTLDDLKMNLLFYLLIFLTCSQILITTQSWLVQNTLSSIGIAKTTPVKMWNTVVKKYATLTKHFFGLTAHPVFSEAIHFRNYNHIIAVTYTNDKNEEIWLPIIDKNGQPGLYIYGCNWVHWTFRVNGIQVQKSSLDNGLQRFTAFWANKNHVDLKNAKFNIKVKKIDSVKEWQYDFLNKQIAKPWVDGGYIEWKDKTFHSNVKDIESI